MRWGRHASDLALNWRSDQQNDAVLLAGALKTNDTLTAINLAGGHTAEGAEASLGDFEREELGRALGALLANVAGLGGRQAGHAARAQARAILHHRLPHWSEVVVAVKQVGH